MISNGGNPPQLDPDNTCAVEFLMEDTTGTGGQQIALVQVSINAHPDYTIQSFSMQLDGKTYTSTAGVYPCAGDVTLDGPTGETADLKWCGEEDESCLYGSCGGQSAGVVVQITGFTDCTDVPDPNGFWTVCTRLFSQLNITEEVFAIFDPTQIPNSVYNWRKDYSVTHCDGTQINLRLCLEFTCVRDIETGDPIDMRVEVEWLFIGGTSTPGPCGTQAPISFVLSDSTVKENDVDGDLSTMSGGNGGCYIGRGPPPFEFPQIDYQTYNIAATLTSDIPGPGNDEGQQYAIPEICIPRTCCGRPATVNDPTVMAILEPGSVKNFTVVDDTGATFATQNDDAYQLPKYPCSVIVPTDKGEYCIHMTAPVPDPQGGVGLGDVWHVRPNSTIRSLYPNHPPLLTSAYVANYYPTVGGDQQVGVPGAHGQGNQWEGSWEHNHTDCQPRSCCGDYRNLGCRPAPESQVTNLKIYDAAVGDTNPANWTLLESQNGASFPNSGPDVGCQWVVKTDFQPSPGTFNHYLITYDSQGEDTTFFSPGAFLTIQRAVFNGTSWVPDSGCGTGQTNGCSGGFWSTAGQDTVPDCGPMNDVIMNMPLRSGGGGSDRDRPVTLSFLPAGSACADEPQCYGGKCYITPGESKCTAFRFVDGQNGEEYRLQNEAILIIDDFPNNAAYADVVWESVSGNVANRTGRIQLPRFGTSSWSIKADLDPASAPQDFFASVADSVYECPPAPTDFSEFFPVNPGNDVLEAEWSDISDCESEEGGGAAMSVPISRAGGVGSFIRKENPELFRKGGCRNCQDVIQAMNRRGPHESLKKRNLEHYAKSIARTNNIKYEVALMKMRATIERYIELQRGDQ